MLYVSELLGKPVISGKGEKIGSLSDLIFVTSQVPYITKLQVKKSRSHSVLYPSRCIKRFDHAVVIENPEETTLGENEVYMRVNLLDQQVIDIQGKNIVRVNDIVIQEKPQLIISGIDIGVRGILRWFHLERAARIASEKLGKTLPDRLLPWGEIQPLELARGKVVISQEEDKLKSIAPEDLADYLEETTIQNAMKILSLVTRETASEVIQNLNINYQTQIFRQLTPHQAAQIVTHADPDEAADLLLTVHHKKMTEILELVDKQKNKELTFLLSHSGSDIGELMTTEFLTFTPEDSAQVVRDRIRKETREFSSFPYGYVLNKKEELVGAFSLHELLLQSSDTQLIKFMMQNVAVIHLSTPRSIALKRLLKYRLRAIPVIDSHRKILGIVTVDDMVEPIVEKI